MNITRFKEVVSSFLDSNDLIQIEKGVLVLQLGTDLIKATLSTREGTLFVEEDGFTSRAEEWIVNRVAMLPLLAERIISNCLPNPVFVTPTGDFLDEIDRAPGDNPVDISDAVDAVDRFLSRRPGGTCSVLYLTSDAGEGKTTLINHLARIQAERFRQKKSDWLLVPIGLGGRPFLRFDDVVVAALMNQLRFRRLYFDAFLQLVRMGIIIPALDGFEEIFVETSEGDAISSLGGLIRQLQGEGTLLIAARKAFFEFRRLQTQARLLDALPDADVGFGRVSLKRWSKEEFIRYCELSGLQDAEEFYGAVAAKVRTDHPLLTRAVLVRRLVELAQKEKGRTFVENIRPEANKFMTWLVDRLLEREATEKWIDKHGETPKPLLSVQEHHELLRYVAEEMWISKTAVLNGEMLDSLAELFSEIKGFSPVVSRQIKDRLKQHALLVSVGTSKREFAFDHDDFREFFLGGQLADHLRAKNESDIKKLFRIDIFPTLALDTAVHQIAAEHRDSRKLIELILSVGFSESSSTFVRENAGALIAPLLEWTEGPALEIENVVFPVEGLRGKSLKNAAFKNCYFRPTQLEHSTLTNCSFVCCEFEHLGLVDDNGVIQQCTVSRDSRIHSLTVTQNEESVDIYNPDEIEVLLTRAGFTFEKYKGKTDAQRPIEIDQDLKITEKALQTFHRSTSVSEGTFRLRLSINANHFLSDILPKLLKARVLEISSRSGATSKYKLGTSLSDIAEALERGRGSLNRFLTAIEEIRRP